MNKFLSVVFFVVVALLCIKVYAQQTLYPKHGVMWISFEESGHQWMVGADKDHAIALDDPGFVQTDFGKGYCIRVCSGNNVILYHNCSTTNIVIGTNYTGTIQIGTTTFKISDFLQLSRLRSPIL